MQIAEQAGNIAGITPTPGGQHGTGACVPNTEKCTENEEMTQK